MLRFRLLVLAAALSLCVLQVSAAEVSCDEVLCFSAEEFPEEDLAGICITGLPEDPLGTVRLGSRLLRPGDILTAEQLAQVTFVPMRTEEDREAQIQYLPIFSEHVAPPAAMTISIRGKEDKPPVAEDSAAETYKNLPLEGKLDVADPEGQPLTFTLIRAPRRGEVALGEDGTYTYTPKKNKVGVDSFVFTATDSAGKVSREATVTVTILKPTDAPQYTDTVGKSCRFAAEWMKNTGIFVGETIDGNACFHPDKTVSRGEFITMLVRTLDIPVDEEATFTGYADELPGWLKPYVAAAVRSGLVAGLRTSENFGPHAPVTGAEAAVLLQNALDLPIPEDTSAMAEGGEGNSREAASLQTLGSCGITLEAAAELTRAQTAEVLYQAKCLCEQAPGPLMLQAVK